MRSYTIQPGDNLWSIAQQMQSSVEAIVAANPGVTPYNLFVGQGISIPTYAYRHMPINQAPASQSTKCGAGCVSKEEMELRIFMRVLWEEHVAWTRMAIISLNFKLPDIDFVIKRLLRNATDMGNAFKTYYGEQVGVEFAALIKDHLVIAAELVKAAVAGNNNTAAAAEKRWFQNAADIAVFMNRINPLNWPRDAVNEMMNHHLQLTKLEAICMIIKNFEADVAVYDQIEKQARGMADTFSDGITKQFPNQF
ncbi:LysM peptidoglycan-binding domain-containing protein [Neobacillus sp. OS1-2]|uniref:LysM peptidoglycan-binding domain-containing protein n=1 Tax=Neobacillus sp. OS1-2 TaxID=3070680 RepID=UPI0027DF74F7|nr:LysM peptidoglycan-binding domain-containing protein [Neobacillus sp. OS1-2]WML38346.1 LysM peptidoglycan-binding domain-containing protein [Neobacillus sp. OS1-2]